MSIHAMTEMSISGLSIRNPVGVTKRERSRKAGKENSSGGSQRSTMQYNTTQYNTAWFTFIRSQ